MSKKQSPKKSPPKTKARKQDHALAFRRAFIHTVALEYYRRRGKVRPVAEVLEMDTHTVYDYMQMPEWGDALKAAEGRFNDELLRSMVLTRGVVDRIAIEKVLDWMDDPKGIHDGPFCRIIIALLNSLGLSASGPQIGITASANAGSASVTPNGTDAFQVYEAQWLTENREQWGEALTQKVRAYLATSIPVDPTSNAGPTKSE
jgi:hypothetical protein